MSSSPKDHAIEAYRQWHRETAERFRAQSVERLERGMIGAAESAKRMALKHDAKADAGPSEAYLNKLLG
jgi:hypothetical protein